ncbi:cell division protein FtsQ/DivIB [bacterium]|nr:cell division protein FtsQ/DivIB [bacterium]
MKRYKSSNMASRKSEGRKGSFFRWALISLIVFVTGGGIYLWFFTEVFSVREINMYEGTNLPVDLLSKSAEEYVGCNIFMIPLDNLKEKLMEFSDVSDIVFRRNLFHSINCYLKVRKPVAAVLCGDMREVDENGIMLSGRVTEEGVDLPLITGINDLDAESGKQELKKALEVLGLLKECGFSPARQLSEIHIENEEITLVWMDIGSVIRIGKEGFEERIRKLKSVYSVLEEQQSFPKMVDLRFNRQVVIR